ncbi:MAG: hypothetical protein IZT56_01795 [Bacteroidetes bacterium]|nr:hypothetical protein [Bacteroidota bacterium]
MNFIKKSIFVLLLISVSASSFAQKKKSAAEKRAVIATDYVAEKMSLDTDKKAFVYDVLLDKFSSNLSQLSGKNLSQEEKKAIFKASNKVATKKLKEMFSAEEIKQINKYQIESNSIGKK